MRKKLKLLTFVFFIFFFSYYSNVNAVTVGPVKIEYTLDPGSEIRAELYVKNDGAESKTFYPVIEKFEEKDGKKVFFKNIESSISMWISGLEPITLGPYEDKRIQFSMDVPENAPPGGHYAVIWWTSSPPNSDDTNQQLSVVTRAGILVYINVNGEVRGSAYIDSLKTKFGNKIFWTSPNSINFNLNIVNDSNLYIKPEGEIIIKNIFGKEKVSGAINPKGYQILSDSKKIIEDVEVQSPSLFLGLYKVEAKMSYGNQDEDKMSTKTLWLFFLPMNILLPLVLFILLFVLFGPSFIKKYNNYIIKKHSSTMKK